MGVLYILMGAPGAGKSSFIEKHYDPSKDSWISRDKIRFSLISENDDYFSKEQEVFKKFVKDIDMALNNGFNVFADATHLNKASRRKLLNAITSKVKVNVIWIKTSLEECLNRNNNRKGTRAFVPEDSICSMYKKIQEPELEEGFDSIYIVKENEPIQILTKWKEAKDVVIIN